MAITAIDPTAESPRNPDWPQHFERWRQSGLTQSEYCRQAGLSRHRFKYWRRQLEPTEVRRRRKRASGFVPVQVRPSTAAPSLTLTLPNGMVLRGIDAGNVELVKRLVEQL
jgi:hypothetical protein